MHRECIEREILEALVRCAPLRVMELTKRIDEHPIAVDNACARLHDEGAILPLGRGKYVISESGRRRLAGSTHD